jgi:DNA topoisomerase-1
VKWEKINATLPKDSEPDSVTLEQALELIEEKAAKKGKRRKAPAKKKASSKT